MVPKGSGLRYLIFATSLLLCTLVAGCRTMPQFPVQPCPEKPPAEKEMVNMPEYTIEPPDVLNIEAIRLIPKPGYTLQPFDTIKVEFPAEPTKLDEEDLKALETLGKVIRGTFQIDPDGNVRLGTVYGAVRVANKTVAQAEDVIRTHIIVEGKVAKDIVLRGGVTVDLAEFRGLQSIRGEHLVRPDGTVNLGIYGTVYVCGLTEKKAREAIEEHLTQFLEKPEILLEVSGFNHLLYYIIVDGGPQGDQIVRQPVTGNDTVLSAIAQTGGLPATASRARIWLARPAPGGKDQIMPIYWRDIIRKGRTETNYQLLPGDRLYLAAKPFDIFTAQLNRILHPVERVLSTVLLGNATIQSIRLGTPFGFGFGGGFPGFIPTPTP